MLAQTFGIPMAPALDVGKIIQARACSGKRGAGNHLRDWFTHSLVDLKQVRDRLRNVTSSIAEAEAARKYALSSGDDASQEKIARELEELAREKKALTGNILKELGLLPNESGSEANGRQLYPPSSLAASEGSSNGGRWFPKPDWSRALAPIVRSKERLPRIPSGEADSSMRLPSCSTWLQQIRPRTRHQYLARSPPWRSTGHPRDDNAYDEEEPNPRASEVDHLPRLPERPWPRAYRTVSERNGSGEEKAFDGGDRLGGRGGRDPHAEGPKASQPGGERRNAGIGAPRRPRTPPRSSSGGDEAGMRGAEPPWPPLDAADRRRLQQNQHQHQHQQQRRGSPGEGVTPPVATEPAPPPPTTGPTEATSPREGDRYPSRSLQQQRRRATEYDGGDRRGNDRRGGDRRNTPPREADGRYRDDAGPRGLPSPLPSISSPYGSNNRARLIPPADGVPIPIEDGNGITRSGSSWKATSGDGIRPASPGWERGRVETRLPGRETLAPGHGGERPWSTGDPAQAQAPPSHGGGMALECRASPVRGSRPLLRRQPFFSSELAGPMPMAGGAHNGRASYDRAPSPASTGTGAVPYSPYPGGRPMPPMADREGADRPSPGGVAGEAPGVAGSDGGSRAVGIVGVTTPPRMVEGERFGGPGRLRSLRGDDRRHDGSDVPGLLKTPPETVVATKGTVAATGSSKGCQAEGCDKRPIYAYKGSKKAAYCAKHRVSGMVDTRHPLCKNEQCTRQPSFGMEGDRRASYCAEHKLPGMINVASRRCQHPACLRHPNFGFPGDRRASYCSGHREAGMVDIVSRRCRAPNCERRPLYNMDGLRPVCCSQHKAPGMIDVVSTRCQEPGCFCHPSFGYAHDKKARRCARHRLENMEGVKGHRQKRRKEATAATASNTGHNPNPNPSTALPPPTDASGTGATEQADHVGRGGRGRGVGASNSGGPPTDQKPGGTTRASSTERAMSAIPLRGDGRPLSMPMN